MFVFLFELVVVINSFSTIPPNPEKTQKNILKKLLIEKKSYIFTFVNLDPPPVEDPNQFITPIIC